MPTNTPRRPSGGGSGRVQGQRARAPQGARRPSPPKRRNVLWRYRRVLFLCSLMAIVVVSGVGYTLGGIDLPPERTQAQTSFVCAADVASGCNASNAIASFHESENRTWVPLDQIPQVLIDAVLTSEDREFFSHQGVDPMGILRALINDLRSGATQGGSTITQQYVKQVYLQNEANIRSGLAGLSRKVREAVMAVKLEQELTKNEILERYLNTIYFGRGTYGVAAATRGWFGHDLDELTLAEAAFLTSLIPSPETADPKGNPQSATNRRWLVLNAMAQVGKITDEEAQAAHATPWVEGDTFVTFSPRTTGFGPVKGAEHGMEYVRDYIVRDLEDHGFTRNEIYSGGLRIYSTIDLDAQRHAFNAVTRTLDQPDDPRAALVAIDPDGMIRAMVGGTDYETSQVNVAVGAKGGGSGWQPGSAFKPFALAEALEQGISMNSWFSSPNEVTIPKANAGAPWVVRNAEQGDEAAQTLLEATRTSSNTVYAQLMVKVGAEEVVDLAKRMGITADIQPNNALVLGAGEVSPLDMAAAYSTLARRGERVAPLIVTHVERPNGEVVRFHQETKRVLSEEIADQVTYAMRQVVTSGTGTGANPGFPVAGKTGTTDGYRNAWFVGYTPNGWTVATAMGYDPAPDDNGVLQPRYMRSVHGQRVYGGTYPATIFRRFMANALDGVDVGSFRTPTKFPGEVLNQRLATSTTTSSSTTSTTEVDASSTTTSTTEASPSTTTSTTVASTTVPSTSTTASTPTTPLPTIPSPPLGG